MIEKVKYAYDKNHINESILGVLDHLMGLGYHVLSWHTKGGMLHCYIDKMENYK